MHGTAGVGAVSLSVAALVAANKHTTGTASSLPIEVKASAEAGGGRKPRQVKPWGARKTASKKTLRLC